MRAIKAVTHLALAAVAISFLSAATADADDDTAAIRQEMKELGLRYKSAWALYQALEKKAGGGEPLTWRHVPDWRGVYVRNHGKSDGREPFDPDGPPHGDTPTAKFTPEYHTRWVKVVTDRKNGLEYDPLSQCIPPGYPRWLNMPFLREFIVTPYQTTMLAEAFNSVRRIYTDGRGHIPEEDRYPTENGDTIGFWDGDRLITYTNQLMAGTYGRAQGFYSEQVESVEIWEKIDDRTVVGHVWIYDPPGLLEPWYTRQSFTRLHNPDKGLRIRHWACKGNPNNDVVETEEGGSQFTDFTFIDDGDEKEGKDQ